MERVSVISVVCVIWEEHTGHLLMLWQVDNIKAVTLTYDLFTCRMILLTLSFFLILKSLMS